MEFPQGRRERFYREEEVHQENSSKNPSSSSQWVSQSDLHTAPPVAVEREHMFEKVVTPSDVGKLNRLVIPKQHAERHFPLDPTSNENGGLLLNFEEDRTGKSWCFRYSYWNSSQSYVMTKGWSRFVKDKRLDAGDTVSFSRSLGGRLFIDWHHRPIPHPPLMRSSVVSTWGWGGLYPPPAAVALYFRSVGPSLQVRVDGTFDSVPVVAHRSTAEPKRVRLFGVNLECSESDVSCLKAQRESKPPPLPLQWRLSAVSSPERKELSPLLPAMDLDSSFGGKEEVGR